MTPLRGGAAWARSEIGFTVLLHEHLAGRRLHPHPAHGRHRRPALPRVRRHARASPSSSRCVISLTTTPMMCAQFPAPRSRASEHGRALSPRRARLRRHAARLRARARAGCCATSVDRCCRHARHASALTVYLYIDRAQGLLPAAGHRPLDRASSRPTQDISFDAMTQHAAAVRTRSCRTIPPSTTSSPSPAAAAATRRNTGRMFVSLKPLQRAQGQRRPESSTACARSSHRSRASQLFLQSVAGHPHRRPRQRRAVSVHPAGRQSRRAERLGAEAARQAAHHAGAARRLHRPAEPRLCKRPSSSTATLPSRLGVTPQAVDNTLYDAFGQRQVSHHVHRAQPVPRRAWRSTRIQRRPRRAEQHLRPLLDRHEWCRSLRISHFEPRRHRSR